MKVLESIENNRVVDENLHENAISQNKIMQYHVGY